MTADKGLSIDEGGLRLARGACPHVDTSSGPWLDESSFARIRADGSFLPSRPWLGWDAAQRCEVEASRGNPQQGRHVLRRGNRLSQEPQCAGQRGARTGYVDRRCIAGFGKLAAVCIDRQRQVQVGG